MRDSEYYRAARLIASGCTIDEIEEKVLDMIYMCNTNKDELLAWEDEREERISADFSAAIEYMNRLRVHTNLRRIEENGK